MAAATGIQFGHIQTYGLKVSRNHKGKGNAWTVGDIAKEASRDPEHSHHVENPQEPVHLHGFKVSELEQRMNDFVEENRIPVEVKGKIQMRKARADSHTLMTGVYSWPEHMDHYDKMDKERLQNFIDDVIAFHAEEFGEVHCAELHLDEEYPHLHVYTMHEKAKEIHPGHAAKAETYQKGLDDGLTKKEASKEAGKAYRQAMKGFQDRYFEKVGLQNGLERLGPGRTRMSRGEFRKDKANRVKRGDAVRAERRLVDELKQRRIDAENALYDALADVEAKKGEIETLDGQKALLEAEVGETRKKHESLVGKVADLEETLRDKQDQQAIANENVRLARKQRDDLKQKQEVEKEKLREAQAEAKRSASLFQKIRVAFAHAIRGETKNERALRLKHEAEMKAQTEKLTDVTVKQKNAIREVAEQKERLKDATDSLTRSEAKVKQLGNDIKKAEEKRDSYREAIARTFTPDLEKNGLDDAVRARLVQGKNSLKLNEASFKAWLNDQLNDDGIAEAVAESGLMNDRVEKIIADMGGGDIKPGQLKDKLNTLRQGKETSKDIALK